MMLGLVGCSSNDHSGEATSRTILPENNDEQPSADEAPDAGSISGPNKSDDGPTVFDTFDEALEASGQSYDFFLNSEGKYEVLTFSFETTYGGEASMITGGGAHRIIGEHTEEHPGLISLNSNEKIDSWDECVANLVKIPIGSTIYTHYDRPWKTNARIIGSQYITQRLNWNPDEIEGIEISSSMYPSDAMESLGYTVYDYEYFGSDNPTSFTWGYYKGTVYCEKTERVDDFALQYADFETISLPVEKTKKGYFTIDTSSMSEGIYYIEKEDRVVEFVR